MGVGAGDGVGLDAEEAGVADALTEGGALDGPPVGDAALLGRTTDGPAVACPWLASGLALTTGSGAMIVRTASPAMLRAITTAPNQGSWVGINDS